MAFCPKEYPMSRVNLGNLTFLQLEALVSVVEERTFVRAARRMHLTQPSLTKHIQHLEELVGVPLLTRGRKGVSITPEGRIVFDYARRVLRAREETAEKLARAIKGEGGEITIAGSTIPSAYILPRVISDFHNSHPRVVVSLISSDSAGVMAMVEDGEVSMGFVGLKPPSPKLISEALWEDRLALVASSRYLLPSQEGGMDISDLMRLPFITRERGSGTREIVERWMKEKLRIDPSRLKIVACLGSAEAVKEAVVNGLGVTFLSRRAIERELKMGILKEIFLVGGEIRRDFYVIYRRTPHFLHYEEVFLSFVRSSVTR